MLEQYQLRVQHRTSQRQFLHALLALITGVLALIYPNFLYLIAGGYLMGLGVLFAAFKVPAPLSAVPLVAGVLIFIFPELIPYTFAGFLSLFGMMLLMAFQFTIVGALTLLIALLIFTNPDSVAYLIAFFLLLHGVSNMIRYFREGD